MKDQLKNEIIGLKDTIEDIKKEKNELKITSPDDKAQEQIATIDKVLADFDTKILALEDRINSMGGTLQEGLEVGGDIVKLKSELASQAEALKTQIREIAESTQTTEVVEKEPVREENKDETTETIPTEAQKNNEQKESVDGELNKKYNNVLDKVAPLEQKLNELEQKEKDLVKEKSELKETGNEKRLQEIMTEFEKIELEKNKIQRGEKIHKLLEERNKLWETRSSIKAEKYSFVDEKDKYDDKEKRLKESEQKEKDLNRMIYEQAQDKNWEENGLDGMDREGKRIRMEFKKEHGYDEDFAREAKGKLDYIGARDANRIAINNYLGLELPIFSREFKLKDIGEGRVGNKFDFIQDNSSDGKYNKNLLAQKQLALWEKVKEARETLSKLSKEDKSKLAQENQLIFSALKNVSGSPREPLEDNLSDVFMPMAGTGKAMYLDNIEDYNLFPDKGIKVGDEILSPYDFEIQRYHDSTYMMNALILEKIAKEQGLIKE